MERCASSTPGVRNRYLDKYLMSDIDNFWKICVLNMIQIFQGLFLATTTWDFFLTIIVKSHRSLVFSVMAPGTAMFIIVPWILGIFILSIIILSFFSRGGMPKLTKRVNYEYGLFIFIYGALAILAIFNPIVMWPVVMNYIVNIIWAGILIYIRSIVINKSNM